MPFHLDAFKATNNILGLPYREGIPERRGVIMTNITRETIITALRERDYDAIPNDVIKNGVILQGITIRNETNIAPTIYIDKFIETFDNLDDIVEHIITTYEENKNTDFNIDNLTNRDWILEHLYIALQKSSDEPLIKRTCELDDIEQFLYIRGQSSSELWCTKLNTHIMKLAGLSIDEVWEAAKNNTFLSNETVIENMADLLDDLFEVAGNSLPQMYVISNKSKVRGSVQVLDKVAIRNYFPDNVHRLVCIPSSIHECILIPADNEDIDVDMFNSMVQEVNTSEVDVTEQLGSHIYILQI